jgi:nucleotide-binding universal stress UspA family protein
MQLFRTILFAADFSENSKEAFRMACSLAVESKTRLIVFHVIEPNWVAEEPVYSGQPSVQFIGKRDENEHEAMKREMRDVYTPNHPIEIQYHAREGNPKTEILLMADEIRCDLIVMGTHGRTGLRWLLSGSVAIAVLREAQCPVLALRTGEHSRPEEAIRAILHPTDFSVSSEAPLRVARSLARDHGARLIILHVAPMEILTDGTPISVVDPQIDRDALERARQRVDGPALKYPVEIMLRRGFAPDAIIDAAEEVQADLIVMGTHGRTGLRRVLMGSVVEAVVPKAECPVLVVKESQPASAATSEDTAQKTVTVF